MINTNNKSVFQFYCSGRLAVPVSAIKKLRLICAWLVLSLLTACGISGSHRSPDVIYSKKAEESKQLQVPPDLTNINNGEQFILPGTEAGSLSRNRLLPSFSSARYIRQGEQNWLELQRAAEAVWPLVLDFVREQKIAVEKTQPTTGLILTQWRSDNEKNSGGLLKNLISSDELFSRYAFRLERNGAGTRLFVRAMQATADQINEGAVGEWPASSHNPEAVSAVLMRLLVFMGADEQKANGILSGEQASVILDDAELQRTAAGSQLVVHKGFAPSFDDVRNAIDKLNYAVIQSDSSVGRIQVNDGTDEEPVLITLTPVHISAVRVSVTRPGGSRLDQDRELALLRALHEQIV